FEDGLPDGGSVGVSRGLDREPGRVVGLGKRWRGGRADRLDVLGHRLRGLDDRSDDWQAAERGREVGVVAAGGAEERDEDESPEPLLDHAMIIGTKSKRWRLPRPGTGAGGVRDSQRLSMSQLRPRPAAMSAPKRMW